MIADKVDQEAQDATVAYDPARVSAPDLAG